MPLNSCSADALPQWFPIKKKKKIPLTEFTHDKSQRFCVTTLWEQMETGAMFSKQVDIKHAQSESHPAQTKS